MTIKTISFHQRSTGMTGQVLASPQIEAKLARVEALYEKFHGVKLGRYKLYREVLAVSREVKAETGGYIQYDAQAVAGKVLDQMHKALGEAIRHKDASVGIGIGSFTISNLRDLARGKRGRKAKVA